MHLIRIDEVAGGFVRGFCGISGIFLIFGGKRRGLRGMRVIFCWVSRKGLFASRRGEAAANAALLD